MSDRTHTEQSAETLRCVECAATSTDGVGWRALLTAGDEEAEDDDAVAVYCPECAVRRGSSAGIERPGRPALDALGTM